MFMSLEAVGWGGEDHVESRGRHRLFLPPLMYPLWPFLFLGPLSG